MPGPHHYLLLSPGKLVGEGTFLLLRKKQRNKVMIWSLGHVIAYRGLVLLPTRNLVATSRSSLKLLSGLETK